MSYSSEVLADSPLGYWKLDENPVGSLATSAADAAGGSSWAYSAGVTFGRAPLLSDGGYSVSPASAGIAASPSMPSGMSGASVSVEAWVRMPASNVNGPIIKVGNTQTNGWGVGVGGTTWDNGGKQLILLHEGVAWKTTAYSFGTGIYHVVVTRSAANLFTVYVNGSSVYSSTFSPTAATGGVNVGGYTTRNLSSTVGVDNVALFSSVLSSGRVTAHYNSGAGDISAVTTDSPVAFLKFDEISGTLLDSSGNYRVVNTVVGSPTFGQTPAASLPGTSSTWDGTTQSATLAAPTFLDGLTNLTVETWFKTSTSTGAMYMLTRDNSSGAGGTRSFHFYINAGKLTFLLLNTGGSFGFAESASTYADGNWHHAVGTFTASGGAIAVYVDGASVGTGTLSGTWGSTVSSNLVFAGLNNGGTITSRFTGSLDDVAVYGSALNSTRVAAHYAAGTASATTGSGAATAPTASASGAGLVTIPGAGTATAPAPTATGAGTSTVTGSGTASAPTPSATGTGISDDTTFGTGTATAPAPTATGAGTSTVTGSGAASAPLPSASGVGDAGAPASLAWGAPVLTDARWVSSESMATLPDVSVWGARVETAARMRLPLVLAAPPLGVLSEWPLERQAHIMPALSAANPRYRPYLDYAIERGEYGRPHVLVGGVDVTYLRGVPVRFSDYTSSVPFGPASASLSVPQMKPWDEPGTGDLSMFTDDARVEIAIARPDDTVEQVWEGFLASDEDNSGENREDYTFHAEGIFAQAMHEPYDPPVYLPPTDPAHIVADVLNSVTHRRWNKIPHTNSGLPKVTDRGRPGQSKWQRVQDVLSKMLTVDGGQWTLARVAPYTYRVQLKATTAVADWTVTKGAPGVECSFVVDQATRRDCVYGRGYAPDGGFWDGHVFPGLDFGVPPRYPMDGLSNLDGRSDATTDTGNGITLWQRKMRDLGYPVTVDGVMNSADSKWVRKIQRDRALTVDGSLGPQTWAATWENNSTEVDDSSYRLPLVTLPGAEPNLYSASGAIVGANPADDKNTIRHGMPEVDFGSGIKKSDAIALAQIILEREQTPGIQFRVVLTTDPHQPGSSRFDIKQGDNIEVLGHRGTTVGQISEVSVSDLTVTITADTKARDSLAVEAILERNEEARRDVSSRTGKSTDASSLNKSAVVPYESESKAGKVPRTAVNGNSGLWTVRKIYVSQIGVAKVEFDTSPNAELVVALFNRPIRISVLESLIGAPLASSDGWYDNIEKLQDKYGLMEVFGSDSSPGGYWPRQKGDGPLTGKLRDSSSLLYDSPFGGFVWVAMFTSKSAWVEGRVFPATEQ